LDKAVEYLKKHPEVEDVIISGGDPLVMSNAWLRWILTAIRAIPSVQVIRIGTKVPVVLPQRINESLVKLLSEFHPLYINTHFNHPNEVTPESQRACEMLVNHGIPVGNQSVLLRGVNDNPQVYEELCRKLIRMRVRPYYLYQCDLVKGVEHFRTPIATGLGVMYYLRGRLSGIGIPQFIIDSPGGKGKIPILPDYVVERTDEKIVLRNHLGGGVEYPEPKHSEDGL
jgi:lysine 2,3-aminomutase